jgi:hypothetical protein
MEVCRGYSEPYISAATSLYYWLTTLTSCFWTVLKGSAECSRSLRVRLAMVRARPSDQGPASLSDQRRLQGTSLLFTFMCLSSASGVRNVRVGAIDMDASPERDPGNGEPDPPVRTDR